LFWISRADFLFPLRFPLSAYGFNKGLHPVCTVLLHGFVYIAVGIQGERSGCMSLIVLYCLYIITGFEGNHCVRVAQIVKTDIFHVQFRHNKFECPV